MACALVNTISRHPSFLVLGAGVRCRARTLHLAEPPLPKAVVPGGWIDLTREGFCYEENFGILSFSVMAQSLVNWPYEQNQTARGHGGGSTPSPPDVLPGPSREARPGGRRHHMIRQDPGAQEQGPARQARQPWQDLRGEPRPQRRQRPEQQGEP